VPFEPGRPETHEPEWRFRLAIPLPFFEDRVKFCGQVAGKYGCFGLAVEGVVADRFAASGVPMMTGSVSRPCFTVPSRVARTAAIASTSTAAPEKSARLMARSASLRTIA